jgi:hypothetical protein
MAKTYYKYKERNADPIDYLQAGRDITAGVTGVFDEREKVRGEIEAGITAAEKEIADQEMGDEESLNGRVLDVANNAAQELLQKTNLLRNGKMKAGEFAKFKQNTLDGMADFKKGAASMNKNLEATEKGVADGKYSSAQATLLNKKMMDTWFDRTRMFTSPTSGSLMIVRTDENGKDIKGSTTSMRNFTNQAMQEIPRFNVEKETSSFVKTIGEDIRISRLNGMTIEDALDKTYTDATGTYTTRGLIEDMTNALDDAQISSILVDDLGYEATDDPNEKGKVVKYIPDPTSMNKNSLIGKPTLDQKAEALKFYKNSIYAQLDYKETAAPYRAPKSTTESAAAIKARESKQNAENTMNRMREFFEGSTSEREQVLTTYIKETQGIIPKGGTFNKVEVIGDKLFIRYTDKDGNPTEFPKGGIVIPDNLEDFVKTVGPVLTGNKDLHSLLKGSGVDFTSEKGKGTGDAAFEVGTEEYKGQELADLATVEAAIPKLDGWYAFDNNRRQESKAIVKDFIAKSGIKGADFKLEDGKLSISVDGIGSVSVDMSSELSTEKVTEDLSKALKNVHEAVSQGKKLPDGAEGGVKKTLVQLRAENPTMSLADLNKLLNNQ